MPIHMPKIGFVDCLSNAFDSFELATAIIEKNYAGTTLQRLTAPEILKIPVCAKKLLVSDADAVVVFATAVPEADYDSLHLLLEKTIDLEVAHQKYVFYCVVSEEEFSSQTDFEVIASKRLDGVFDLVLKSLHSPAEVSSQIGTGMDFSMFASLAAGGTNQEQTQSATPAAPAMPASTNEEAGKSLF